MEPTPAPTAPGEAEPAARPVILTVVCVIGFIGSALAVPLIFSDAAASVGAWYPPFLSLSTAVGFICMVGLWRMQRWAVYLYTALMAAGQVLVYAMGAWNVVSLVVPALVVAIAFANLSKMR